MIKCRCPSCCSIFGVKSSDFGTDSACPSCGHRIVLDNNLLAHFQFPNKIDIKLTDLNGQPVRQSGIRVKSKHGFCLLDIETDSEGTASITRQHYERSKIKWLDDSFSIMDHPGDYSVVRYITIWVEGHRSFGPVKVDLEQTELIRAVILEEKMPPETKYHETLAAGCGCKSADKTRLHGRRGFLSKMTAIIAGAMALLTPAAAGIWAFLNPLRQKSRSGEFIRVTSLAALPDDGTPQKFPVIADRCDAWNRYPREPIGAVYLRRSGKDKVEALQAVCPHAGCILQTKSPGAEANKTSSGIFYCPCHGANFDLSGRRADSASPSPRDMDSLEAEIRDKGEVWVKFRNFIPGIANKVAQG
jgi:menaquinol-cytochrome c reductase iron-sulfur subunit